MFTENTREEMSLNEMKLHYDKAMEVTRVNLKIICIVSQK